MERIPLKRDLQGLLLRKLLLRHQDRYTKVVKLIEAYYFTNGNDSDDVSGRVLFCALCLSCLAEKERFNTFFMDC